VHRFIAGILLISACVSPTIGATLQLTLGTPSPAGTVELTGNALPVPYQGGVNVYAGVLNWADPSNVPYSTYCVDVASVISIGNQYNFLLEDLATSNLFSAPVLNAVENLWAQHPVEGDVGLATNPLILANNAATFQVALWDIISNHFDQAGNPVLSPTLGFSSPANGFTSTDLTNAMTWATNAYAAGTYSGADNFAVLVAQDHGQNQAMFLVGGGPEGGPSIAPIPAPWMGGLVLLALTGAFRVTNRPNAAATCQI
jgi:hypothetical protein